MPENLMKIIAAFVAILTIMFAGGCTAPGSAVEPAADQSTPMPEPTATPDISAELSMETLGDAVYQGVLEQPITLVDGRFEGQPFVEGGATRPIVTLIPEPMIYGDLDGDGRADVAVLLATDTGGSGTFIHLAAVALQDGKPVNLATTLLGDRVRVQSLNIDNDRIEVVLLTQGPDDPQCCPSQEERHIFRLREGLLVEEGAD